MKRVACVVVGWSVIACGATAPPQPAAKPSGPRIEWPSAYAQQVHFPLYLDDDIPVCIELPMVERTQNSKVICEPLGVLRWQLTTRRAAK